MTTGDRRRCFFLFVFFFSTFNEAGETADRDDVDEDEVDVDVDDERRGGGRGCGRGPPGRRRRRGPAAAADRRRRLADAGRSHRPHWPACSAKQNTTPHYRPTMSCWRTSSSFHDLYGSRAIFPFFPKNFIRFFFRVCYLSNLFRQSLEGDWLASFPSNFVDIEFTTESSADVNGFISGDRSTIIVRFFVCYLSNLFRRSLEGDWLASFLSIVI